MNTMNITVHLHTILQRQTPDGPQREVDVTLLTGSSIEDLLHDLGVTVPIEAMLMVMNGRLVEPQQRLQDGDQIHLMPAMSGGS